MCCRRSDWLLGLGLAALVFVAGMWTSNGAYRSPAIAAEPQEARKMLLHNVYFSLKNDTPEGRDKLVAACKKYLVKHPGVTYFAVGTPSDLNRPVNDRNFAVGLHVMFADRAAHDAYQTAPDHLKFIEENRETWSQVRVFDTDVDVVPVK